MKKIKDKLITKLESLLGKDCVFADETDLEAYSHDETPGLSSLPEVVIKPGSEEQIKEILCLANEENFPVTPRGGGTGLSGGAIPAQGGVVLALERLNRILEIDGENSMAVVQAGVINGELQRAVEKENLFYPVNPASMDSCTLGGNVAAATGGANTVRYGTTRDYVKGVRALLPTGDTVEAGGKISKNSTDHRFIQLVLGSEGTLAVISQITFKLIPHPSHTVVLTAPFNEYTPISKVVLDIFRENIIPTMIELLDNPTIKAVEAFLNRRVQYDEAAYHLQIRLDSFREEEIASWLEIVGNICLEAGAEDVLVAEDSQQQERVWEFRRNIHEALVHKAGTLADEDVVVPRSKISDLLKGVKEISERHGISVCNFGHLGDGNIHVNFLKYDREEKAVRAVLMKAIGDLFQLSSELGGKISGEHGIGLFKKSFLGKCTSPGYIETLRLVKKALDPNGILNPGKIVS